MPQARAAILHRLQDHVAQGRPIVMQAATSRPLARNARDDKADLIMLTPHRDAGLPGVLASGNANRAVRDLGVAVLDALADTPVVAAVNGTDPFTDIHPFLKDLKTLGFAGVQNAPSVGRFTGRIRASFEETGMPYAMEVAMIAAAHQLDLLTTACVHNPDEAVEMTRAGADILVAQGMTGREVALLHEAGRGVRADVILLCQAPATPLDDRTATWVARAAQTGLPRPALVTALPAPLKPLKDRP